MAGVLAFWDLGAHPMRDYDEAWHARIALDIARNDRWFTYLDEGQLTPAALKPPLYLWTMAASFRFLGPSELAARLFPAACHVLMVAAVAWWCSWRFNGGGALAAAFLLSTDRMLVTRHGARSGEIDPPLVLFLTLTVFAAVRWREGRGAWWGLPVWSAALLTKGTAALQIVPVLGLWLLAARSGRGLLRLALVGALGAVPLGLFMLERERIAPGYVQRSFRSELVDRVVDQVDDAPSSPLRYAELVLRTGLPAWIGLALTAIAVRGRLRLARQVANPAQARELFVLLLLWFALPIVAFSFMQTRRDWYVYPSLVAGYVLAAWMIRAGLSRLERLRRNHVGSLVALVVIGGAGLPAVWRTAYRSQSAAATWAEHDALLAEIARQQPAGPVLCLDLLPVERFVLARAGIDYRVVPEAAALHQVLATAVQPTLVLTRPNTVDELIRHPGVGGHTLLRLPVRESVLLRFDASD